MTNTLTKIQTITVGSTGVSSITFTSIPQTFNDIVILSSTRSTQSGTGTDYSFARINGDSSGLYSDTWLRNISGSPSTFGSGTGGTYLISGYSVNSGATANVYSNNSLYIPNYTSSSYKSSFTASSPEQYVANFDSTNYIVAGLYRGTSPVTSLSITNGSGNNFSQYSEFTLYGI